MRKSVTPGRLALWGLYAVGAYVLVGFVFTFLTFNETLFRAIGIPIVAVGILLLLAAAVAKVIQIGVRSARDD